MLGRFVEKKDNKSQFDPQVGAAAAKEAQISEESMKFSQDYYSKYVAPMIEEMTSSSRKTQDRLDQLFTVNMDQMKKATDRYDKYGVPAEDRYFNMVDKYSAPEEENRQAGLALGDVRQAEGNQQAQMNRSLAARGIDLSSPAAVAAMRDMAIQGGAMEAGAKNRARTAAKTLGMALTQDAANFGRGGQSSVLSFGGAASGNATGGFSVASNAVGSAGSGAAVPMQGYGLALQGYGNNLSAYTSLANTDRQIQAQSDAGFGQFLGTAAQAAATAYASDRRLKKNITRIGTKDGLGVYRFQYVDSERPTYGSGHFIGYMADEVEHVMPDAVSVDHRGYKMLDYTKLPSLGA